jgi:ubiquinone/menaquinone biosynthesis C-methylase UbiE
MSIAPPSSPLTTGGSNQDPRTVSGFGDEWERFSSEGQAAAELDRLFAAYFEIFPWSSLAADAQGMDVGAGSGRWAARVAPRVRTLHVVDASERALGVAQRNLRGSPNCRFHLASVENIPLEDGSLDFGYSLGVLHHVPDTQAALRSCVRKLKIGAPFLLYLYYALDNRSLFYRQAWRATDVVRRLVARFPMPLRYAVSQVFAGGVYWPLARASALLEAAGLDVSGVPLSYYRKLSFYVMRTDALDRFGTRLERRFTRGEIEAMMRAAGLESIVFREGPPYWCALGRRAS